jgi:cell wall-associated NlpC family hydrolase
MKRAGDDRLPVVLKAWMFAAVAAFLLLSAGCATKTATPPEEAVPVPPAPAPISVSHVLLQQYDAWKGVSYRFGGTGRSGIDCSGFMLTVFRDGFGLALPRTSIEQSRLGQAVPRDRIRSGDLLFFSDRRSDHIGVALDGGRFLHASTSEGVTVSSLNGYWQSRLSRVSRILDESRYVAGAPLPLSLPAASTLVALR